MKTEHSFTAAGYLWVDATTYSRFDNERKPDAFETVVGKCRIYITNAHINHKPNFIFHCHALGFDTFQLPDVKSHEAAAEKAIQICMSKVKELAESFNII